jgi:hypothetical protein
MTLREKAKEIAESKGLNFENEYRKGSFCPGHWIKGYDKVDGFLCKKYIEGLGPPCSQCWNEKYEEETAIKLNVLKIDVTEIARRLVRCEDCAFFTENKEAHVTYCNRELKTLFATADGFCSYGERKEAVDDN